MQITIELPDDFFTRPKSEQELLRDVQQAAAMYWVVRGDIPAERAADVKAVPGPPLDLKPRVAYEGMNFKEFLMAMPDVGDESVLDRRKDAPREEVEWDT
jgi:hypothetical protein